MPALNALESDMQAMPPQVRELGSPWRPLAGTLVGLSQELENEFRFGQKVIFFNGLYRLGGNIKGGSSSIWSPSTAHAYKAYCRWRDQDGIPADERPAAFQDLLGLLGGHGISLLNGNYAQFEQKEHLYCKDWGYLYEMTAKVLRALPEKHLQRDEFRTLQLGGWGPDCAKGSAYEDRAIRMYDFALEGALRTYVGLLLHELGHAQEVGFPPADKALLKTHYRTISQYQAVLGVEYLLDAETRRIYQLRFFEEFLAELYMIYTSQGGRLRQYVASLTGPARSSWEVVYDLFRKAFDGIEYE
ncbi:MAG: hypothetical protein HYZ53_01640 [Planctomycetes bacterium]|nr:hypothetical protein [Planctomycetota bacterium]